MKKSPENRLDELRDHYDFDYDQSKPNRFATAEKVYKQTLVILDEDVSRVFDSSEAVNTVLRTAVKAMRTAERNPARKKATPKRRAS